MQIIPTIELQGGKCVSLVRGNLDEPMIWHVDPVETAHGFATAGAEMLRVTDFDAIAGIEDSPNGDLIREIIRSAGIPVQVAGGMRSRALAEAWIEAGAGQVVVGSLAAVTPDVVKELAKYHPGVVMLSLDVMGGQLMTNGWRNTSAFSPEAMLEAFDGVPLAGVVVTDIDADNDDFADVDAKLGVISGLAAASRLPIVASGLVRDLDDIARLKYVHNISGALVGRALFRKSIDLGEALNMALPEHEETARFQ